MIAKARQLLVTSTVSASKITSASTNYNIRSLPPTHQKTAIAIMTKRMKTTGSFHLPTLADLCDEHISSPTRLAVVEPGLFHPYGKLPRFFGQIATVRCFESNPTVREMLSSPGYHQVLVVDGGGSKRVAMMGDELAKLAAENNWAGVIVNGCIRDSAIVNDTHIGVRALGTHPVKSLKTHSGDKGVKCAFGGVEFVPGHWCYVDEDGILVSAKPLHGNENANKLVGVI